MLWAISSSAGFSFVPNTRYYDLYNYEANYYTSSSILHSRGLLGDATRETVKEYGNESGGWYSDYARLPYSEYAWIGRSGGPGSKTSAGIFYFGYNNGNARSDRSYRAVLSAQDGSSNTLSGN